MTNPSLLSVLEKHAMTLVPEFNQGFIRDGGQWFTGRESEVNGRTLRWASFGDFSRNLSVKWDDGQATTPAERAQIDQFILQAAKENRRERERHWELTAKEVEKEWAEFSDLGESPYLARKGLPATELAGCRLEAHERGARTIVPARDVQGTLWGYQRIFSEKLDLGDKFFRQGARKEGCFHAVCQGDTLASAQAIYLCEGIATALSVAQALSQTLPVVSAFDAGNLGHVARDLRRLNPSARLIFCADHDQFPGRDGTVSHAGERKAHAASEDVGNAEVILAMFNNADLSTRPTDFDDVRRLYGQGEVCAQLTGTSTLAAPARGDLLAPPVQVHDAPENPKPPSEAQVVDTLLKEFGDFICKHDKDIFLFKKTHWHHLDPDQASDFFKNKIEVLMRFHGWKTKDFNSCYTRFLMKVPRPPEGVDIFAPRPDCVNLLNGTLHVVKARGAFKLEFRPHAWQDYLRNVLPYHYQPGSTAFNSLMLGALDRIFDGQPEKEILIQGIQEMYAAVICGQFPMLFMLHGLPGTGKSTLANVARHLAGPGNVCSVPPTRWNNFHMWQMIGKQVNIDTDIPTQGRIQDDMIKKVIEGVPVYVQRKNISDVETKIPSANIFCANKLPKFIDGETGAQDRRWNIFVTRNAVEVQGEGFDARYWDTLYNSDPQGLFNWAVAGLQRLCVQRGKYTRGSAALGAIKDWQESSDATLEAVNEFLDALERGEVSDKTSKVRLQKEGMMQRSVLWTIFRAFHAEGHLAYGGPSRTQVFEAMRLKGFGEVKSDGLWYFRGLTLDAKAQSAEVGV